MAKEHWRARRFLKHQVVEGIDEAEHICVPGIPLFDGDQLSLCMNDLMEKPPRNQQANLSLLISKFPYWFVNNDGEYSLTTTFRKIREGDEPQVNTRDYEKELLMGIARLSKTTPLAYDQLRRRHYSAPDGCDIYHKGMTTTTRLLIGHSGSGAVLKTGITLHPYYGFPLLPGSAIKGVTRHYCYAVRPDEKARWEQIFGNKPESREAVEGAVVFYDAWPEWNSGQHVLEVDNLTTHYPDYYKQQQGSPTKGDQPAPTDGSTAREGASVFPADNQGPIPVFFLAVPRDVTFRFAVRPSSSTDKPELAQAALDLIGEAVVTFGIGAKTGSSYGYFRPGSKET